jgi:hypothetical protein
VSSGSVLASASSMSCRSPLPSLAHDDSSSSCWLLPVTVRLLHIGPQMARTRVVPEVARSLEAGVLLLGVAQVPGGADANVVVCERGREDRVRT